MCWKLAFWSGTTRDCGAESGEQRKRSQAGENLVSYQVTARRRFRKEKAMYHDGLAVLFSFSCERRRMAKTF